MNCDLAPPPAPSGPKNPPLGKFGLIIKGFLAVSLPGLALFLVSGCGLTTARPNLGEPYGFQAEAAPEAGPLARDLSRILNQTRNQSGATSSGRQRLEITLVSLDSQVQDGYDLALITVWGPQAAATVADPFKHQEYQVKRPQKKEEAAELPYRNLAVSLRAEYRLLDGDGRLLAQGDCRLEEDFKYGGLLASQGLAPPLEQAPRQLEDDPQALKTALTRLASRISRKAPPFGPGEAVVLDLGRDPQTAAGVRAARAGDWPEARRIWMEVLEANPKYAPAQYNLGVAEEIQGDAASLAQARQRYRAAQLNGRRLIYREALARVTARLNELGLAIKADLGQD